MISFGLALPGTARAETATQPDASTKTQDAAPLPVNFTASELAARSDVELTALTARWGELAPGQRRMLLAEVRSRMARNNQTRQPKVSIRVQRKYGRVLRKPDGSVVVETRVVEMRPRTETARGTFGVGFERRTQRHQAEGQASVESTGKPPRAENPQADAVPTVPVSQSASEP